MLAARPRQAGQRCPDTARSVQKVEARTGAVVSEDVLWPTRRASVAAAPVAVCSIEEEHTWLYGEIYLYYAADFGTQAMLLLCIVVVASVRSLAICATRFLSLLISC